MADDQPQNVTIPAELLIHAAHLVGNDWKSSRYYQDAEAWLSPFWADKSPFLRLFSQLDLTSVLELACGHGRHSFQVRNAIRKLILMDINEENIAVCRQRFIGMANVEFATNDGFSFRPVPDDTCTAIFCYDAMVHFDSEVVYSYLRDSLRILRRGGMALFHHSNYTGNPGGDYRNGIHWRNFMSKDLFWHYARKARLEIVDSVLMDWGEEKHLDCLTLVKKP